VSAITLVSAQLARHARPAFSVRKPQSGGAAGYQFNKDYENMKKNFTAGFRPRIGRPRLTARCPALSSSRGDHFRSGMRIAHHGQVFFWNLSPL
jgi:hypothetical protein